ncbi:peptidoglycan-binding domain-containing protein [Streptomyces narbonensis]|uniref:peptidoglycan-binding domain-containing protein n=1 Tax=Streptomyces narbonensis TaxID=67333 RepID=UPI0034090417
MALQLESARFRGDPVLERIRAADTSAYLKYGQSGSHVMAVQYGLIDLDHVIPSGTTCFFGNETSQAVTSFKQDEGLRPADPVVGVGTITALDGTWAIPNADRAAVTQALELRAKSAAEGQARRLIWHSFESSPWRPAGVDRPHLRRHWRNTLFLTPSEPPAHPPFVPTPSNHALHYYEFMEPVFLVDQNRVITLFGPTMFEAAALVGFDMHRVWDVWPPGPEEEERTKG